jgi:hypothetical protein
MDALTAQILEFWKDELITLPSTLLDKFKLPQETREFLQTVGLPMKEGKLSTIASEALEIGFYKELGKLNYILVENQKFIAIAQDADNIGVFTCIEEPTGKIYSVANFLSDPMYINSSIKELLAFLRIYIIEGELAGENLSEKQVIEVAKKIKTQFQEIDAKAMAEAENFWPEVLSPLEQGFLL